LRTLAHWPMRQAEKMLLTNNIMLKEGAPGAICVSREPAGSRESQKRVRQRITQ
jgi:hypothetical protein